MGEFVLLEPTAPKFPAIAFRSEMSIAVTTHVMLARVAEAAVVVSPQEATIVAVVEYAVRDRDVLGMANDASPQEVSTAAPIRAAEEQSAAKTTDA